MLVIIYSLFCVGIYCQSSSTTQNENINSSEIVELTEEDIEVLKIISDELSKKVIWGNKENEGINQIIVSNKTSFSHIDETAIKLRLNDEQTYLTFDIFLSYRKRNSKPVFINSKSISSENIIIDNFDETKKTRTDEGHYLDLESCVKRKYPKAKLIIVAMSLPAYSLNFTKALVQVSYAPTSHGSFGLFYLVKEGVNWKIKSQNLVGFF